MGSVVLHDIAENMVVAGNPARVLRRRSNTRNPFMIDSGLQCMIMSYK